MARPIGDTQTIDIITLTLANPDSSGFMCVLKIAVPLRASDAMPVAMSPDFHINHTEIQPKM